MANKEELTAYKKVLLKVQKLQAKYLGKMSFNISTYQDEIFVYPISNIDNRSVSFMFGDEEEILSSKYEELLEIINQCKNEQNERRTILL